MPNQSSRSYSETFKLEVLRDYYSSGLSIIATSKKWGIPRHSTLLKWISRYPIDSKSLSLSAELLADLKMKQEPKSREKLLEEEILRLQKALEVEKLRSHAFKKLIELAEKEEKISILKKDGAK
ncbi:MAG: transposase [Bacteroidetes bacterium]|nr:transposase [Bacteroidota bacterium]